MCGTMGCTRGELDAEADVVPVMHDATPHATPHAMPHAMHYVLQGGELDAEADDDILKSSETRTEMKLSADQLYHYELAQPRAEHVRSPARRSHPPHYPPSTRAGAPALGCSPALGALQRRPCRGG